MPKDTFHNLPPAKRQRLMAASLEEFANHDYESASISSIVAQVGIAKGSIYQYFADKKDLFLYLIEDSERVLLEEVGTSGPADALDIFGLIRWQMSATVRAAIAHPLHAKLLQRAYQADVPFADELQQRAAGVGREHFSALLRAAAARGEIDDKLDFDVAAFVIQTVMGGVGPYLLQRLGAQPGTTDPAVYATHETERIFDLIIDALRHGLGKRR